jgi:class 3 adenylate cyclase
LQANGGRWRGLAVTIATRLLNTAGAREVVVSQTAKDLVGGGGFTFHDRGEHKLEDVPGEWHLYSATTNTYPRTPGQRSLAWAI